MSPRNPMHSWHTWDYSPFHSWYGHCQIYQALERYNVHLWYLLFCNASECHHNMHNKDCLLHRQYGDYHSYHSLLSSVNLDKYFFLHTLSLSSTYPKMHLQCCFPENALDELNPLSTSPLYGLSFRVYECPLRILSWYFARHFHAPQEWPWKILNTAKWLLTPIPYFFPSFSPPFLK